MQGVLVSVRLLDRFFHSNIHVLQIDEIIQTICFQIRDNVQQNADDLNP